MHRLPSNYFVSFLLWIITLGMAVLVFLAGRILFVTLFSLLEPTYWVLSFIDRAGVLLIGLVLMILVLWVEYYYRQGSESGQLWTRFFRINAILIAVAVAGYFAGILLP